MKTSGLYKEGWRPSHLWLAAGLMAAAIYVTYAAWADMLHIAWNDEECGHALLAIPAFAWLAWIRRGRLRRCRPNGRWLGTLFIGLGWLIWSVGFRKQWQPFWHGGALIMVIGAFLAAVGSDVFWEFLAAFAVLGFMVPVPVLASQWIAIPLQAKTAQATRRHVGDGQHGRGAGERGVGRVEDGAPLAGAALASVPAGRADALAAAPAIQRDPACAVGIGAGPPDAVAPSAAAAAQAAGRLVRVESGG